MASALLLDKFVKTESSLIKSPTKNSDNLFLPRLDDLVILLALVDDI